MAELRCTLCCSFGLTRKKCAQRGGDFSSSVLRDSGEERRRRRGIAFFSSSSFFHSTIINPCQPPHQQQPLPSGRIFFFANLEPSSLRGPARSRLYLTQSQQTTDWCCCCNHHHHHQVKLWQLIGTSTVYILLLASFCFPLFSSRGAGAARSSSVVRAALYDDSNGPLPHRRRRLYRSPLFFLYISLYMTSHVWLKNVSPVLLMAHKTRRWVRWTQPQQMTVFPHRRDLAHFYVYSFCPFALMMGIPLLAG